MTRGDLGLIASQGALTYGFQREWLAALLDIAIAVGHEEIRGRLERSLGPFVAESAMRVDDCREHVDMECHMPFSYWRAQLGTNMLRPILQMGRERTPVLKDTQTAIEAGFPDFETLAWWGVFAPKDTPPDIIASMASRLTSRS